MEAKQSNRLDTPGVFTAMVLIWVLGSGLACAGLGGFGFGFEAAAGETKATIFPPYPAWQLASIALASFIYLVRSARPHFALVALAIPFVSYHHSLTHLPAPSKNDIFFHRHHPYLILKSTVIECTKKRRVVSIEEELFPDRRKLCGKALIDIDTETESKNEPLHTGQILLLEGRVKAAFHKTDRLRQKPWEFDKATALRRKGIFSRIEIASLSEDRSQSDIQFQKLPMIEEMRSAIISQHRANLDRTEGDLLSSIVLGDRSTDLPKEVLADFRKTGLSHLLAASGFNLSILVGAIFYLFSFKGGRRATVAIIALSGIAIFVLLAGLSASVARAASMWSLIVLLRLLYRRPNPCSLLSLSLFIFVFTDPVCLLDVGLQLSYAATYGIICGIKPLHQRLEDSTKNRPLKWLLELVSVILLAQAAVLPIQLYYFWETGLMFVAANLLLDPVVAPVTICGFLSSLSIIFATLLKPLAEPLLYLAFGLDRLANLPLSYMLHVAHSLASIENSSLVTGPPPVWSIALYGTSYYLVVKNLAGGQKLMQAVLLYSLSLILLLARPPLCEPAYIIGHHQSIYIGADRKASIIAPESEVSSKHPAPNRSLERYLKYHGISPSKRLRKEPLPDTGIGPPESSRDYVLAMRRDSDASIYGITCLYLSRLYPASSLAAENRYRTAGNYRYQYLFHRIKKGPFFGKGLYR
ncbi:MAG: ComEC/Rec2 family competence protein [Cyanobacteriota/Melainabacteria group bacterium]